MPESETKETKETKEFSVDEVAAHNTASSAWIIMENKVYDVTKFLDKHPGGEEVLLEQAGRDVTSSFHDVGHSSDAKTIAEECMVGRVAGSTSATKCQAASSSSKDASWRDILLSPTWSNFLIPASVAVIVYFFYHGVKLLFS